MRKSTGGQARAVARLNATHDLGRVKARVQPRQDRCLRPGCAQTLGHGDDALEIEVRLQRRMLHARAQRQFQAKAVGAQVRRQRAIAVHASIGPTHAFLGSTAVVHRKGIHVQRQPAAGQQAVLRPLAAQQRLDHRRYEVEHLRGLGVHALAQRRAGRQQSNAQSLLEERVAAEVLDRVEVALALHEQTQIAAQDVAAEHTALDGQRCIELIEHRSHRPEEMTYQGQSGNRREVVIQLLDDQWVHDGWAGPSTKIDIPTQLTRWVIGRQHQPYLFPQPDQRLASGRPRLGHGFRGLSRPYYPKGWHATQTCRSCSRSRPLGLDC